ncbi:MAG TPA: hypothetical protein VNH18_25910 [Bryobacteraceae bacterium]|nr:hypothetical protein [Bryobacteraceae bacterium]
MTLGAEPKKVGFLIALLVLAPVSYWYFNSDDSAPAPRPVASTRVPAPVAPGIRSPAARPRGAVQERRQVSNRGTATAWNIRLGSQNPEDRPEPASIDPALKLDLLAKVQAVELGAPGRNLFAFGAPPPPPAPKLPKVPEIPINKQPGAPPPPVAMGPVAPSVPQVPPMTFKYYGYKISRSDGNKAAFLLDGDEILIGGENEIFKKHYRIVRISPASIVIEDMDFKATQTIQIQENVAG